MSYVVHVWEQPAPRRFEDAATIRARLAHAQVAPNPKFARLAARLTERFPDIGDLDEDEEPGAWTDGPLAGNALGAVMGIGVQTHAIDSVVPYVVEVARELGLVVLDEQAGAVHLPDGSALGPGGPVATKPAPAPARTRLTRADVRGVLHRALGPMLRAARFARAQSGESYRRVSPSATFEVTFEPETAGDGQAVAVIVRAVLPGSEADPLLVHLHPDGSEFFLHAQRVAVDAGLAWPGAMETIGAQTPVETDEALDRLAADWVRLFERAVLPLLERCATLAGLERELNLHPRWFSHQRVGLVLAASAGRVDLEAIAHAADARASLPWREGTSRLLDWLRTAPTTDLDPPLDDAMLDAGDGADDALRRVLPVLKSGRPRLPVGEDGRLLPVDRQPVTAAVVGDLFASYVVDDGPRRGHIRHGQLARLGITRRELVDRALGNLRRAAAASLRRASDGALGYMHLDGRHEASLVLLDELWDVQLAADAPTGAMVAIPDAGTLAWCDAAPEGLKALRALVARVASGATPPVSRTVYYRRDRRDRRWEALPLPREG